MSNKPTNPAICSFFGRSNHGKARYAFLSGRPRVRKLWSSFAQECEALDNIDSGAVRFFLHLATTPRAVAIMDEAGDGFLVEPKSLKAWFKYYKEANCPDDKLRRKIIYIAVYAVRYMMDLHPQAVQESDTCVAMIRCKHFATFILKEWTGEGVVGVMVSSDNTRSAIMEFRFNNMALARIYCDYFETGVSTNRIAAFHAFTDDFELSLGDLAAGIKGYGDFGEATLLAQAAYYRTKYISRPATEQKALRHVLGFYRFLLSTREGSGIFDDSNFSPSVIKSLAVIKYIAEGWDFVQYNAIDLNERRRRMVVLFRDLQLPSTKYAAGDAVIIDFSAIETDYFRNLLWRYVRSSVSYALMVTMLRTIADALHLLEALKKNDRKVLSLLSDAEAYAIMVSFTGRDYQDVTLSQALSNIRRFFDWAARQGYVQFESPITLGILEYKSEADGPSIQRVNVAIPHEDLLQITDYLTKKAESSYRALMMLTIVKILATTPFRPSQICTMKASQIKLYEQDGTCFIGGVKKVTRGDKTQSVTHPSTYRWLKVLMEKSESIRERCFDKDLLDLIFIDENDRGFVRIKATDIAGELARVCEKLGLPRWTPYNIRKYYATLADELDRSMGYDGTAAAQLMDHQTYNTTKTHYIDRTFEAFDRTADADGIGTDEALLDEYNYLKGEQI